MINSVTY